MKILYSHRIQSRDGQGVHLDAMVASLRRLGHEVRLVGPPSYEQAELGGQSGALSKLRAALPRPAAELAELAYSAPAWRRLARAADAFRPDAIYERTNLFYLAGAALAKQRRLPFLAEVNAPLAHERSLHGGLRLRSLAHWSERWVWSRADRVLPVTRVLGEHVHAAGVPWERIEVIPNGIHPEEFTDVAAPSLEPKGELTLGFVGFVRDWHGLDSVVRGIAQWGTERGEGSPRLSLLVVGEGPARPGLETLAKELGVTDRVRFTGLAQRHEVPRHVATFDVALQPASVPYASPLKVFEYMAGAKPIVAPDQPNIREVLEDGADALLFDPARPGAMWEAVARLAADPGLRHRLGAAARDKIFARDLTWEGNARRVVRLLERAAR